MVEQTKFSRFRHLIDETVLVSLLLSLFSLFAQVGVQ